MSSTGRSRLPTLKSSPGNAAPPVTSVNGPSATVTRHNTLPSIRSLRKAFQRGGGSSSKNNASKSNSSSTVAAPTQNGGASQGSSSLGKKLHAYSNSMISLPTPSSTDATRRISGKIPIPTSHSSSALVSQSISDDDDDILHISPLPTPSPRISSPVTSIQFPSASKEDEEDNWAAIAAGKTPTKIKRGHLSPKTSPRIPVPSYNTGSPERVVRVSNSNSRLPLAKDIEKEEQLVPPTVVFTPAAGPSTPPPKIPLPPNPLETISTSSAASTSEEQPPSPKTSISSPTSPPEDTDRPSDGRSSGSPLTELVRRLSVQASRSPSINSTYEHDGVIPGAYVHTPLQPEAPSTSEDGKTSFFPSSPKPVQPGNDARSSPSPNSAPGKVETLRSFFEKPDTSRPKSTELPSPRFAIPSLGPPDDIPDDATETLGTKKKRWSQAGTDTESIISRYSPSHLTPGYASEKRWSIAEIEAAYNRMKGFLRYARSSNERHLSGIGKAGEAGEGESKSFVLSDDGSSDIESSFIYRLIEAGSAMPMDSSIGTDIVNTRATGSNDFQDEEKDSLAPLATDLSFSPSTSPHLGHMRSLSPLPRVTEISPISLSPVSGEKNLASATDTFDVPTPRPGSMKSSSPEASMSGAAPSQGSPTNNVHRNLVATRRASAERVLAAVNSRRGSARNTDETTVADESAPKKNQTLSTPKNLSTLPQPIKRALSPTLTPAQLDNTHSDTRAPYNTNASTAGSRGHKHLRPLSYSNLPTNGEDNTTRLNRQQAQHSRSVSLDQGYGARVTSTSPTWFDDTPRATHKIRTRTRAESPKHALSNQQSDARAESPSDSIAPSEDFNSIAEAKRTDKIGLYLRCTKAEAAYNTLATQFALEREALLDALRESRIAVEDLRRQREELGDEVERLSKNQTTPEQASENSRRLADLISERATWQARAQAAEKELTNLRQGNAAKENAYRDLIVQLKQQIALTLDEQSTVLKPNGSSSPASIRSKADSLKSSSGIPRAPKSGLPVKTGTTGLPRSRTFSSHLSNGGSTAPNVVANERQQRAVSAGSSNLGTDFADHLPAASDRWSLANNSQEVSLRLDENTAKFLQDLENGTVDPPLPEKYAVA